VIDKTITKGYNIHNDNVNTLCKGRQKLQIILDIGYSNEVFYKNLIIDIPSQGIISIIGTNGCGKSTLYKTLMGIIPPIQGQVPLEFKKRCAIVSDYVHIPEENRVKDVVELKRTKYNSNIKKYSKIYSYITSLSDIKVKYLSSGQKRILEIYMVLLSGKNIVILDEASNALDFENKDLFFHYIHELSNQGILFFHTSHDFSEVLSLTKHIYFLDKHNGVLTSLGNEQINIDQLTSLVRKKVGSV
jgi:ABC-type cobalamin/Fe3+-siderophores transport systems, ATPase components